METLDGRVQENFKKESFWSNVKAIANTYGASGSGVATKIAYDADLPGLVPPGLVLTGYFLVQAVRNYIKGERARRFLREYDERDASTYTGNPFAQE